VNVESGDIAPADGRILRSSTLEVQEAALTGESQPVGKQHAALPDEDIGLGDRISMVYQSTSVTRGTGTIVVTATGMNTEMGRIATLLTDVKRTRSPLQQELDTLTKVLGIIAWTAVAVIVGIGYFRGLEIEEVLLLGTAMAISAIPTGMPTFVQGMLSYGAKQLAEAQAVVRNLTDVETLGSTSAINTDKTGTLTMNEMMVSTIFFADSWYTVEGEGYAKQGTILGIAGAEVPDFTPVAYGLSLDSDATVSDIGEVVGDPTEAALVVLAARVGVDAEETRRTYPRLAEVPFDSEYKFMATLHRLPIRGEERLTLLVKGAPDVVLQRTARWTTAAGESEVLAESDGRITAANERMAARGLRVLAFAATVLDDVDEAAAIADPMSFVRDLRFVAMVGIIDPLRPAAKEAVRVAHSAGIDVRMITGDHAITAQAIGEDLGLGLGAISGPEFARLTDTEVVDRLDGLHVFGRVTPDDKLRLVQLMQREGEIVAMTGDAVNDAAALKQADIGVAMGSGSEVSKQAAKMILTDDNFGTLVHAVELGRSIYRKVLLYVRYQMSQLLSLIILFLTASVFNINSGVALTPSQVLFLNFLVAGFPVVVIILEPVDPSLMRQPPRDPSVTISNSGEVVRWLMYGSTLFLVTLVPLLAGPDDLTTDGASTSMTMAFVIMAFGTLASGLAMRRDPHSGLTPPILRALQILAVPAVLTLLATEMSFLQGFLDTVPLTGPQWLVALVLAIVPALVIEADKAVRRRGAVPTETEVAPSLLPDRAVQVTESA
jgi:Ca2+-transporting ATPase